MVGQWSGLVWFFQDRYWNSKRDTGTQAFILVFLILKEKVDWSSEVSPDRESGWFFNGIGK